MFRVAPSRFTITASYDPYFGWSCRLHSPASDGRNELLEAYGPLSAPELLDALSSALAALLAL